MKRALYAFIVLFAVTALPAMAYAQGAGFDLPQKDSQVCQSGRENWAVGNGLAASGKYHSCTSTNVGEGTQFKALRVDPGRASVPHEIYGNCFYIDNYSTESFFVPAATPAEWASFVQNHPQLIDLVPCCRPEIPVSDTCNADLDRSNYQRPGYSENHTAGLYGARAVTLSCELSANGRSAQWDLIADTATSCDAEHPANPGGFRTAAVQGVPIIRNIPID